MKHEPATREDKAMVISFPAPKTAISRRVEPESAGTAPRHALFVGVASAVRRGYERVCSAIFDPEGDCMRF
jgi:hypothetical protein